MSPDVKKIREKLLKESRTTNLEDNVEYVECVKVLLANYWHENNPELHKELIQSMIYMCYDVYSNIKKQQFVDEAVNCDLYKMNEHLINIDRVEYK